MKPAVNICRNRSRFPVLLLLLFFVSTTLGYINPTIKKQPVSVAIEEAARDNRIWVPPTQNVEQLRRNIFCIKNPEDLLDFISEDERLCVGETCVLPSFEVHFCYYSNRNDCFYNLQLKSTQTGAEHVKLLTPDIEN